MASAPNASESSFKVFNDSGAALTRLETAVPTNAVVATCVVLVPAVAVGAAGVPVNVGDASLAIAVGISESGTLPFASSDATPSAEPTSPIGTYPVVAFVKVLDKLVVVTTSAPVAKLIELPLSLYVTVIFECVPLASAVATAS